MKFPIRTRILLWISFIILELMVLLAVFLHYQLTTYLYQNFDQYIYYKLEEYSAKFLKGESLVSLKAFFENEVQGHREELGLFIMLFSSEGRLFYRSSNLAKFSQENPFGNPNLRDVALGQFREVSLDKNGKKQKVRVITLPVRGDFGNSKETYLLQIAFGLDSLTAILTQHRSSILSVFSLIFFLTLMMGWLVASKAFQPVEQITKQAEEISNSNLLHKRLTPLDTKDELAHLVSMLNKMLEHREKSVQKIQQFTANAAHEIRTPLTSIRGELELLLLYPTKGENEIKIASVLEEIERLSLLCKRLLLLARLDEGVISQQLEEVHLGEILRRLLEQMYPLFDSCQILLKYEETEEALWVKANENLLYQVFLNLLDNAVKYGGKNSSLTLQLSRFNTQAQIVLQDTGPGIAPEHLPYIFERFYRGFSSEVEATGSGLGLAIVKEVLEFYQGTIFIESVLGHGTCFTLRLPLCLKGIQK